MLPKQTDALDAAFLIPVAKMAQGQAIEKELQLFQCLLKVPFHSKKRISKILYGLLDDLITQKTEEASRRTYILT